MSVFGKTWQIIHERQKNESLWSAILNAKNILEPADFFSNANLNDLHDPYLFEDMRKAVSRVEKAIVDKERIWIYGDYDVDGTSGAALLVHTLKHLKAEVSYRIPNRLKEGYGLHDSYVEEAQKNNVKLIITVDLGISCKKQIDNAENLGINMIITDHHSVPKEKPNAFAILHPALSLYPFKYLSGSGMAFKLAQALLNGDNTMILALTDLASLGTVADMVPLIGENRILLKLGLEQMQKSRWHGLNSIIKNSGAKSYTSETIGFLIGPRINAAGRMDNAYWAMQTLLAGQNEATEKSHKLEQLNRARQDLTTKILDEALATIENDEDIIIAYGKNWSSGLVGLIAGKIQEKFSKPTFILDDRGDSLIGSARSVQGFNITDAIRKASHLLESFGGHEQAAGFHLKKEKLDDFKKILREYSKEYFQNNPLRPLLKVDTQIYEDDFNLENIEKIQSFAPFGVGNEEPSFIVENLKINTINKVGKNQEHLKFSAFSGAKKIDGIAFKFSSHEEKLRNSSKMVVKLKKNEWKNKQSLELHVLDFA